MEQWRTELIHAGFWIRFVAYFIDSILVSIASYALIIPAAMITAFSGAEFSEDGIPGGVAGAVYVIVVLAAALGIPWLYEAILNSSERQGTFGKSAVGLKVTDVRGGRISFARATGRFFAKFLSAAILMIGYFMQPFTAKKQALHDILAGTLVVRK